MILGVLLGLAALAVLFSVFGDSEMDHNELAAETGAFVIGGPAGTGLTARRGDDARRPFPASRS